MGVPYRLVIQNYDQIDSSARQMANDFVDLIGALAGEGCPVEIRVEPPPTQEKQKEREGAK